MVHPLSWCEALRQLMGRAGSDNVAVGVGESILVLAPFGVLGDMDLGACSPPNVRAFVSIVNHRFAE